MFSAQNSAGFVPAQPEAAKQSKQWHNAVGATETPWHTSDLPRASSILYTVSSEEANFGRIKSNDDTLVLVVARDLFIGCYNFEDYLSPNFETLFVFDKRYADLWGMEEMVLSASSNVTLGAHLAIANGSIGEQSSRKMSLDFVKKFDYPPEFIFSVNCDIHPIPNDHDSYQSFPVITHKLSTAFKQQKRLRSSGQGALVHKSNLTKEYNEVYGMNMLLFEAFGGHKLEQAFWHGKDPWRWWRGSWKNGKPQALSEQGQYWVTTVNKFVESHAVMYDREKMEIMAQDMFITDCIPSETHAVGQFAAKRGWSMLRNNEVYMFFDVVKTDTLSLPRYTSKLNKKQVEYMKLLNWELLASRRNPRLGCEIAHIFQSKGIRMDAFFGTGFTRYTWRDHWSIKSLRSTPAGSDWTKRWITASMLTAGWAKQSERNDGLTTYHAEGCYPSTLAIETVKTKDYPKDGGHIFVTFDTNGNYLSVITRHPFDHVVLDQSYPKKKRSVQLPLSNSTIARVVDTTLHGYRGWTNFHIHGEDCTDRVNVWQDEQ